MSCEESLIKVVKMKWIANLEGGPKRVNHAAVAVGHKIYSFGGYCTGENSREYTSMDVHILNTTTFRWSQHPVSILPYFEYDDILPYKRYGHTAVVYGELIYIWGGRNDRASCSTLFCFDATWNYWNSPKTTGNIPLARDGHTACIWKNYMIIFGGYEEDSDAFARSIYTLNLDTMHWTCIDISGPEPPLRDFHTAVVIEDRMYLFGGRGTMNEPQFSRRTQVLYCNNLWYLDLNSYTWVNCNAGGNIPIGRRSHSAFVHNNKMYIFGGYNSLMDEHYNDIYEYNPCENSWKLLSDCSGQKPCKRRRQACVVVGDKVFIFGGTSPHPSEMLNNYSIRNTDDGLIDHSDMFVLDFNPSLKTLCMIATRKLELDESVLPQSIRSGLSNMFTPNKITKNRPNNSAG